MFLVLESFSTFKKTTKSQLNLVEDFKIDRKNCFHGSTVSQKNNWKSILGILHHRNACSVLTVTRWLCVQRSTFLHPIYQWNQFPEECVQEWPFSTISHKIWKKVHIKVKEKANPSAKDLLQKMKECGNNPSGSFARILKAPKWSADANKASHLSGPAE